MKTLTELSGIMIRKAAAAVAEAKRALPREAPVAVEAPPPAAPAPQAAPEATPEAAPQATPEATEAAAAAVPAPTPAPPPRPASRQGPPPEPPESDAARAAFDAAVAAATGLSGDRLARLRDAVKAVGGRVDDVRLVRVFGPEEPVPGAATLNGFQYLVDVAPASMRQVGAPPKKERFGRGGDKGRGPGTGGKGAPASGGFSMDSLKDDRKGQRGGPGRGKPGGGGR